jgi:hypothetical protein
MCSACTSAGACPRTEARVEELLAAQAYRDRAHVVLVVDTTSLVAA